MKNVGRVVALVLAIAMFAFSLWIYSLTGDWVAIVFALGSAAYGIYFYTTAREG